MCDVQFGVVARPTHPSSPWDAAKFEVCAHRFVDVAEPDFGVAILNNGRFGHGVFGGRVRVSIARAAQYPDPLADRGHHTVSLAVRPHGAGLVDVRAAASRFNHPLRVIGRSDTATPAPSRPVVQVSSDPAGVEVDAVKLADDGSGDLIVRLHEAVGNRTASRWSRPIGSPWRGAATSWRNPRRVRRSATASSPSRCDRSRSSPSACIAPPTTTAEYVDSL